MQYLKDEIRKSIVDEALKEFKKNGFKGASIRSIVKFSHTSVGNFYKYYSSKDDLYEKLIGSVYHRLMNIMNQFNVTAFNERTDDIFLRLMENILEICKDNNTELAILLNKSEGSKYENCKNAFVGYITNIVSEKISYELALKGRKLKDNFIIYLISWNLMESIAIILREKDDGAEIRSLILEMINVFYNNLTDKLDTVDI